MKVGPYCVPTFTETVGAKRRLETHERNEDDEDESNFDKWKLFVNQNRLKAPKDIGMSSLYPFCDVITNALSPETPQFIKFPVDTSLLNWLMRLGKAVDCKIRVLHLRVFTFN